MEYTRASLQNIGHFCGEGNKFGNFPHIGAKRQKEARIRSVYIRFSVTIPKPSDLPQILKEIRLIPDIIKIRYSKRWDYEDSGSKSEKVESRDQK